jgi:S-adenosylmethionine decarboxylase
MPGSRDTTDAAGCGSEVPEVPQPTIRHLLIDAGRCTALLNDSEALLGAMRAAAARVGATEVGDTGARYVPHGITAVLFLAESHILVSTWPEHELALVDIQFCDPKMNPEDAWAVLKEALGAQTAKLTWVQRGPQPQSESPRTSDTKRASS